MRSVEKGPAPSTYRQHREARNDLAAAIGWYCAYCEMPVSNMIEVEHVHPTAQGGAELDWHNLLLSCRYCNSVKSDNNTSRVGYLWPDIDNTILAFEYSELDIVKPQVGLPPLLRQAASETIKLMGLDRRPGAGKEPAEADSRWMKRIEAIGIINESYHDWHLCPTPAFARQIARTALGHGFYSFWMLKFVGISLVIDEINRAFRGTYFPQYDANGALIKRAGGTF
jgi:uncharacterized protein (TIGR02646 family)